MDIPLVFNSIHVFPELFSLSPFVLLLAHTAYLYTVCPLIYMFLIIIVSSFLYVDTIGGQKELETKSTVILAFILLPVFFISSCGFELLSSDLSFQFEVPSLAFLVEQILVVINSWFCFF